MITLTITVLVYFGLYRELSKLTMAAKTLTVSSEGPAAEMYPDSMGQYNLLKDVYRYDRPVYKHVDREDRFIIYIGRNKQLRRESRLDLGMTLSISCLQVWTLVFKLKKKRFHDMFLKVNSGTSHMTCLSMTQ